MPHRELKALASAVANMRAAHDELERVRPNARAYIRLMTRAASGDPSAVAQFKIIAHAKQRFQVQKEKAKLLVAQAERAIRCAKETERGGTR